LSSSQREHRKEPNQQKLPKASAGSTNHRFALIHLHVATAGQVSKSITKATGEVEAAPALEDKGVDCSPFRGRPEKKQKTKKARWDMARRHAHAPERKHPRHLQI
jgi:hypothetical protein